MQQPNGLFRSAVICNYQIIYSILLFLSFHALTLSRIHYFYWFFCVKDFLFLLQYSCLQMAAEPSALPV